MHEYRCTRPDRYGIESVGRKNALLRSADLILAKNEEDAYKQMSVLYPHDSRFDVVLWRTVN